MLEKEEKLFNEVFLQYNTLLFSFGKKIIRDESIIEECIQELFLYIYQKEIKLSTIKNVKAYLLTSFRRRILLKKKVAKFEELSAIPSDLYFAKDDFLLTDERQQQRNNKLIQLLNELPWRQREAIYLKYFNNLSAKEVAEIMGIQPQVVANMVSKVIKKLRFSFKLFLLWCCYFFIF
ncbi:MAG: RNA polymerase sigma factor [Saprospiraceae bacterium]